MKKILSIIILFIMTVGCAEFTSYAIGALGNITGDLVMKEIEEREKDNECKDSEDDKCGRSDR